MATTTTTTRRRASPETIDIFVNYCTWSISHQNEEEHKMETLVPYFLDDWMILPFSH